MNKIRILVTGASGQLGSEIKEISTSYKYDFFFKNKNDLDITDKYAIKKFLKKNKINVIINCAAYTAVDKAETDIKLADKINRKAVKYLAKISQEKNIKLIHISTDYVFDGTFYKPYIEQFQTNPKSIYGQTKLDGEIIMQQINPSNSIIIRTSWIYSSFGNNFVKTMLKLGNTKKELDVIFDQTGTPTYAKDLAYVILDIVPKIKNKKVETYHYSNEGVTSWYDFAYNIMETSNIHCKINPIETKDYPTPAFRPHYSILNKSKIKKEFNVNIPYWKDSLKECLHVLGNIK